MNKFKSSLKKIISEEPSNWKSKSIERKNSPWLRAYSSKIARRVLSLLEDNQDLNQKKLAEVLLVSPQQINKIVKGQENLTLETIYKLSRALESELISFPDYKHNTVNQNKVITVEDYASLSTAIADQVQVMGSPLQSLIVHEVKRDGLKSEYYVRANFMNQAKQVSVNG
jgi:transcriptional regulator with XRE-family HTH domain